MIKNIQNEYQPKKRNKVNSEQSMILEDIESLKGALKKIDKHDKAWEL